MHRLYLGVFMNENEFEDILAKYPDFIEDGLKLVGRQITIFGRRIDLLFEDRFGHKLLIELKLGPIRDTHIGQILSYEGHVLSDEEPVMRVMLIGNRVPPNIRKMLNHHGIAWREITYAQLREMLTKKNDDVLLDMIKTSKGITNEFLQKQRKDHAPKQLKTKHTIVSKEALGAKLFGSKLRARLLSWFLSHPDEVFYVRQIEKILQDDVGNISRELIQLESIDILNSARSGNQKHFYANKECSFYFELKGLIEKMIGEFD